MSRSRSFLKPAVRVAAAALGSVVAGPLGGALGGLIGDALGGASSELIKDYADKFGDKAAEKIFEETGEGLGDRLKAEGPTLEAAHREALKMSLRAVRAKAGGEYGDWFENWDRCLGAEETLSLAGLDEARFTSETVDRLFDRVLVRIDAQGAALLRASTSLQLVERPAPQALLASLREMLPERFEESFKALIVSEKYEAAWREMQLACGERLEALVRSVKDDTAILRAGMEELLRRTADRAVEEGRLTEVEARAATAEAAAAEWERKYLELVRQNPSLNDLLKAGDLDAAAERKREQIERQREEQARSYFELGQIEELRFDYAKAADAYSEAWRLKNDPEYGFSYAYCAREQRRYTEAIETFEKLQGMMTTSADAAALKNNLAMNYLVVHRFVDAEKAFQEASTIYRELSSGNPAAYLPNLAMVLDNLGGFCRESQRFAEAEQYHGESLEIRRALVAKDPEHNQQSLATVLNNLALVYAAVQRPEDAEQMYREAVGIYRELASKNPAAYLPNLATTLNNLALLYNNEQRFGDAETTNNEALKIRRELAAQNPEAYLPDVAVTLSNLGILYRVLEQFEKSSAANDEALKIRRELAVKEPEVYLPDVALTLNNLGNYHVSVQQREEGEKSYLDALGLYRELAVRSPVVFLTSVATTLNNLVNLYGVSQRFTEAMSLSEEAEQILTPFWRNSREVHGDLMARILGLRAEIWVLMGRDRSEACELARRALDAAYLPALKSWLQKSIETKCSSGA